MSTMEIKDRLLLLTSNDTIVQIKICYKNIVQQNYVYIINEDLKTNEIFTCQGEMF